MGIIKRLLGIIFALLGFVGLLLSIGGIVGAWMLRTELDRRAPEVVASAKSSLAQVKSDLETAQSAVDQAITGSKSFDDAVSQASARLEAGESIDPATWDSFDGEIAAEVETVRQHIESNKTAATALGQILQTFPTLSADDYASDGPVVTSVTKASEKLQEIETLIENARQHVADLRQESEVKKERIDKLVDIAQQITISLAELQTTLHTFEAHIAATNQKLATVESELPQWIRRATIVATCLLAWLALSQLALIALGNRLLRD